MSKHVAINPFDHKYLRIREERSVASGDDNACCFTFPQEFRSLQAYYPILFQRNEERDDFVCLAFFGFQNSENLFLKSGKWDAKYVPLAMSVSPFMIGVQPDEKAQERKIVLDLDHPRVAVQEEGEGRRVFDDSGHITPYLEKISADLHLLDQGIAGAQNYIATLKTYDLLEPLSIDVTLSDGTKDQLAGFHTICEENLSNLSKEDLYDLHAKDYLLPTYMALASLSNFSHLIERKDERISGGDV